MMATDTPILLRKHRLQHLPELSVNEQLFQRGFAPGCSMMQCDGSCCKGGVYADVSERDNILAHADLIKASMEPWQEHDSSRWFDAEEETDLDFPSGRAIGTQVRESGCVFLNGNGHCVLQIAAVSSGQSKYALKPFYCFGYPITIENGDLCLDELEYAKRSQCCSSVGQSKGTLTPIEVCDEELRFMLGEEGMEELCEQRDIRQNRPHQPVPTP